MTNVTSITPTAPADRESAEVAAHAALELIASHPGKFGRLRTARLIGGYTVQFDEPDLARTTAPFASAVLNWSLRDTVELIDALLAGGLVAQTTGPRPTLVLTRPGFRALEALDQTTATPA
jgi:hypothetical protein